MTISPPQLVLATLRQRNFALLSVAGLISFAGDGMLLAALPLHIDERAQRRSVDSHFAGRRAAKRT